MNIFCVIITLKHSDQHKPEGEMVFILKSNDLQNAFDTAVTWINETYEEEFENKTISIVDVREASFNIHIS